MANSTLSAKELAAECDTDGRTIRKFLRACTRAAGVANPGKGQRWEIDRKDVRKLKAGFSKWIAEKAPEADETPAEVEV